MSRADFFLATGKEQRSWSIERHKGVFAYNCSKELNELKVEEEGEGLLIYPTEYLVNLIRDTSATKSLPGRIFRGASRQAIFAEMPLSRADQLSSDIPW